MSEPVIIITQYSQPPRNPSDQLRLEHTKQHDKTVGINRAQVGSLTFRKLALLSAGLLRHYSDCILPPSAAA